MRLLLLETLYRFSNQEWLLLVVEGGAISNTTSDPLLSADITSFQASNGPYDNTKPKAFLNCMGSVTISNYP
jgi:hypothetical protein